MGNKEAPKVKDEAFWSEHRLLQNARRITYADRSTIQAKFKLQNDQHDEWKKQSDKARKGLTEDYLFLPEKSDYSKDGGLCGNTGSLTVPIPPSSANTPTILTSWQQWCGSASRKG